MRIDNYCCKKYEHPTDNPRIKIQFDESIQQDLIRFTFSSKEISHWRIQILVLDNLARIGFKLCIVNVTIELCDISYLMTTRGRR